MCAQARPNEERAVIACRGAAFERHQRALYVLLGKRTFLLVFQSNPGRTSSLTDPTTVFLFLVNFIMRQHTAMSFQS